MEDNGEWHVSDPFALIQSGSFPRGEKKMRQPILSEAVSDSRLPKRWFQP